MKTYDEILTSMTEKYKEIAGFEPYAMSDIGIKLRVLSGEIFGALMNCEWLRRQMFPDTASGEYLDKHAQMRGIRRREAGFAFGEVTFSVNEPQLADIVIPLGTVVATSGEASVRFATTETVYIRATTTSVKAEVKALCGGREYNAAKNTVNIMVTPPASVHRVTNESAFSGGEDAESDEKLRQRIIESFLNPSNGTNCAYYKNLALEVPGVSGAGVVPRQRGAGTVDVYIAAGSAEVSDYQLECAQEILGKNREVNVDVLVHKATPVKVNFYISLEVKDGYEFDEVQAMCQKNLADYVSAVGVGGKVLLTEAGERIYHTEGVEEYLYSSALSADYVCSPQEYPTLGTVRITEGIER